MPGVGSLLSPISWQPCSQAQNRKPAPRSTQTRQGRAGRDKTNTPCEQEVTPCSGGIPSPLAHLPGASHIPARLACPSGGPCPQAACPVWSHSSLSTGAADSTSFPRILQSTQHTSPYRYSKASTGSGKVQCPPGDLDILSPSQEVAEATLK